jgi:hypothetical protein
VKVGSTKALNKWDVSFQHVTSTTAYFYNVPIKAFILVTLHLLLGGLEYPCEQNSISGICIHELSQLDPCPSKMPFGLIHVVATIYYDLNLI